MAEILQEQGHHCLGIFELLFIIFVPSISRRVSYIPYVTQELFLLAVSHILAFIRFCSDPWANHGPFLLSSLTLAAVFGLLLYSVVLIEMVWVETPQFQEDPQQELTPC